MPSMAAINLPDDVLADPIDMLPPLDDIFSTQPTDFGLGAKDDDPLNWSSQLTSDPVSVERGRNIPEERHELYDDDLGLDLGLEDGPSIEVGRNAPLPRPIGDDLMSDDDKFHDANDLDLNYGDDTPMQPHLRTPVPSVQTDGNVLDEGVDLMDVDEADHFAFNIDDTPVPLDPPADPRLQRDSQSPLSSIRSSVVQDMNETMYFDEPSAHASIEPVNPTKKRKVIQLDQETTLHSSEIKRQQQDHSAILKPVSLLPRDPVLLTLMNMQQNGTFVSSVMGDGRAKGWAPELRGILSIEVIRKSGELKRKRDSGVADVDEEAQVDDGKMPQIEIPEEEEYGMVDGGVAVEGDTTHREASEIILPAQGPEILNDEGQATAQQESDEDGLSPMRDNFDDTVPPLIDPIDQGPVSVGTQHAVHLLRNRFGSSADHSPSQQKKSNVFFQELLPEETTSKADATKMFFEVLVLATKDAVKVEQSEGGLGGPIRVRGKRGLWGAWAETEAGGEIAKQTDPLPPPVAV